MTAPVQDRRERELPRGQSLKATGRHARRLYRMSKHWLALLSDKHRISTGAGASLSQPGQSVNRIGGSPINGPEKIAVFRMFEGLAAKTKGGPEGPPVVSP